MTDQTKCKEIRRDIDILVDNTMELEQYLLFPFHLTVSERFSYAVAKHDSLGKNNSLRLAATKSLSCANEDCISA